jgi:hypothetical protein
MSPTEGRSLESHSPEKQAPLGCGPVEDHRLLGSIVAPD